MTEPQYLVVVGEPGRDALTFVGPFATSEEAGEYRVTTAAEKWPGVQTMVDVIWEPIS